MNLCKTKKIEKINPVVAVNNTAQQHFATHFDVIEFCLPQINDAFHELGGITPSVSDLASGHNGFRYCQVDNKGLRKKVGYIIDLAWHNGLPTFLLTVNSFKGGKTSRVVASGTIIAPYLAELNNKPELAVQLKLESEKHRKANLIKAEKAKVEAELQSKQDELERKQRFEQVDNLWHKGTTDGLFSHPYVFNKKITVVGELRLLANGSIAYPLRNLNMNIVGYQIIQADGFKMIYAKYSGSTKGAFGVLSGDLSCRNVFIVEGFATADKVCKLRNANLKGALVLCAVSASNMPAVVKAIKLERIRTKKQVKFHIVADNDHQTASKGKGNTGIRYAMEARLIAGFKSSVYIPSFHSDNTGSDWDDKWREDKLNAKSEFKPLGYSTFKARIALLKSLPANSNLHQVSFDVSKAVQSSMDLFPVQMNEPDIIDTIYNAIRHTGYKLEQIKKLFATFCQCRRDLALEVSSIKHDTKGVEYNAFDSIDEANAFIKKLKKDNQDNGLVVLLKAPMGSGKTQVILKSIVSDAENNGKFPTAVAPVKSLVKACANTFGISHYIDDSHDDFEATNRHGNVESMIATGLAITINSLPNEKFKTFASRCSVFVVDEVSQVLRAITQGTVRNNMRLNTERAFAAMLNKAELSILADADLNQIVVDYVREVANEEVKVCIVEVEPKPLNHITYNILASTDKVLNQAQNIEKIQKDLIVGKNIYCATDSKEMTEQLFEVAADIVSSNQILMINSDTTHGKDEAAFLANANQYIKDKKPRLIIASPSVQSGLSIEVDYFHIGYGFATATVTPTYIAQMLHRVRGLTKFNIALPCSTPKHNPNLEDADFIYYESIKHHTDQFFNDRANKQHNTNIVETEKGFELSDEVSPYCRLSSQLQALDTRQRNNFANFFVLQALDKGIRVNINDKPINDDDKKQLKQKAKIYKDTAKGIQIAGVVGINSMSEDEYTSLKKSGYIPKEKQNEIKRYEVALTTGNNQVTEEDVKFYNDNGLKQVRTYEALVLGQKHAYEEDKSDIEAGVAIVDENWNEDKVLLTSLILDTLGIDSVSLQGEYSVKEAEALMCLIFTNASLLQYVTMKLRFKLNDHYPPIRFVNNLLKAVFGLKAEKTTRSNSGERKQNYALNCKEVAQLLGYVKNRAEKKRLNLQEMGIAA